jgi:hypothetical protein
MPLDAAIERSRDDRLACQLVAMAADVSTAEQRGADIYAPAVRWVPAGAGLLSSSASPVLARLTVQLTVDRLEGFSMCR